MFLFKKHYKGLEREISGLRFLNPVGLYRQTESLRVRPLAGFGLGFLTLNPDSANLLEWIQRLAEHRSSLNGTLLGVNLKKDIERSFSLVYDFADFIIIDADSNEGIGSTDLPDIPDLLEELLKLRLCYEHYTPIFVRLPSGLDQEDMRSLLSYSLLSGINGIVAKGLGTLNTVLDISQRRMPVIGHAASPEEAASMLQQGATLTELDVRHPMALRLLKNLEKEAKNHD